jgi:hypothetical protein
MSLIASVTPLEFGSASGRHDYCGRPGYPQRLQNRPASLRAHRPSAPCRTGRRLRFEAMIDVATASTNVFAGPALRTTKSQQAEDWR